MTHPLTLTNAELDALRAIAKLADVTDEELARRPRIAFDEAPTYALFRRRLVDYQTLTVESDAARTRWVVTRFGQMALAHAIAEGR